MKAYALLGGPKENWPEHLDQIMNSAKANGDLIIGVDRGSILLTELGVIPDLAIGDFDSLKKDELGQIENQVLDIRYSNPIKDLTDSELMIRTAFLEYHVSELRIFGATGGRIDHFLVNLFMLQNKQIIKYAPKVQLIDRQNTIQYFLPDDNRVRKINTYPYFGVASLGTVKNLTIKGAKYSLTSFSSKYPKVFASNEFREGRDKFELSFDRGLVCVIFSKDINRFYSI